MEIAAPFVSRLETLYRDMDAAYRAAADHYGFHCDGCTDNCCLTRFYHHTHLEYLYLRQGFLALPAEVRQAVGRSAVLAVREAAAAERTAAAVRIMCPVNRNGRCLLYAYRPMICRLHGVAHELHPPGRPVVRAPGCDAFDRLAARAAYRRFDRTPFYREMALLEKDLKQALGGTAAKLKMTVAEMIAAFEDRLP